MTEIIAKSPLEENSSLRETIKKSSTISNFEDQIDICSCNFAVLDASNISLTNNFSRKNDRSLQLSDKKLGYFHNVEVIFQNLLNFNPDLKIIPIADASLRYKVADIDILLKYENTGKLFFAPARTKADFFILKFAQLHPDAVIISNDQYKEFNGPFEQVKQRRVPFMIIEDEAFFYEYF